jgi:hypothetical protein
MKNRDKDALSISKFKVFVKFFLAILFENEKVVSFEHNFLSTAELQTDYIRVDLNYFFRYITSFTSFTVLGTSGRAAATRLGA